MAQSNRLLGNDKVTRQQSNPELELSRSENKVKKMTMGGRNIYRVKGHNIQSNASDEKEGQPISSMCNLAFNLKVACVINDSLFNKNSINAHKDSYYFEACQP